MKTTTTVKAALRSPVNDFDIITLMKEAAEAGDREQVQLAADALCGNKRARRACARVIRGARVELAAYPD
jgi:hypothetical protein